MVRYHFITYCTPDFQKFAEVNKSTALNVGKFDKATVYSPNDLDEKFKLKNNHILTQRVHGYWIWKPYIILKKLLEIEDDDVLCYNDSKYIWFKNVRQFESDILINQNIGVYYNKPNDTSVHLEKRWTKMDAYILMNISKNIINNVKETPQVWAGLIFIRKNFETIRFVTEWLTYVQDQRISTDISSIFSKEPNVFEQNRHDQTVLSLLCKKYFITMNRLSNTYMLDMRNPVDINLIPSHLIPYLSINNYPHQVLRKMMI